MILIKIKYTLLYILFYTVAAVFGVDAAFRDGSMLKVITFNIPVVWKWVLFVIGLIGSMYYAKKDVDK